VERRHKKKVRESRNSKKGRESKAKGASDEEAGGQEKVSPAAETRSGEKGVNEKRLRERTCIRKGI